MGTEGCVEARYVVAVVVMMMMKTFHLAD